MNARIRNITQSVRGSGFAFALFFVLAIACISQPGFAQLGMIYSVFAWLSAVIFIINVIRRRWLERTAWVHGIGTAAVEAEFAEGDQPSRWAA